jgi:hypothetical protein
MDAANPSKRSKQLPPASSSAPPDKETGPASYFPSIEARFGRPSPSGKS